MKKQEHFLFILSIIILSIVIIKSNNSPLYYIFQLVLIIILSGYIGVYLQNVLKDITLVNFSHIIISKKTVSNNFNTVFLLSIVLFVLSFTNINSIIQNLLELFFAIYNYNTFYVYSQYYNQIKEKLQ